MAIDNPNIYTIPPSASFLDILANQLFKGLLLPNWPDQSVTSSLATTTIYMPTRRSANRLATYLQTNSINKSLFLPKIISLGEMEDNNNIFALDNNIEEILSDKGLAPAIPPLKRRLILTKLIFAWSEKIGNIQINQDFERGIGFSSHSTVNDEKSNFSVAKTINDGLALADALGYLIDTLCIYKKTWQDIYHLLPRDLSDEYWRISKDFLQIAAEAWPAYCKQERVMDAAQRRDLIISAESERLLKNPPNTPVIIAGSTGSMPSTGRLICSIAKLPYGVVMLQGLDQYLDDETWKKLTDDKNNIISSTHPQALLAKLINDLGINRDDVVSLTEEKNTNKYREIFLSECMRPHDSTHLWADQIGRIAKAHIANGLENISLIEAENEREEAIAISMILRSNLNEPGKTAALITPDRSLAKRVSADLLRWGIIIADSAGMPLNKAPLGIVAILFINAIIEKFSSLSLLALLNHEDVQLGLEQDILRKGISAIDLGLSRISTAGKNIDDLISSLMLLRNADGTDRMPLPNRRMTTEDWDCAAIILDRLRVIYRTFQTCEDIDIVAFFKKIALGLENVLASPTNFNRIDQQVGYRQLLEIFNTIYSTDNMGLNIPISSYPSFFEQLMAGEMITNHFTSHPRIMILGLLEARLLRFDLVILGSLNEAVWPPDTRSDPFLNRPWRNELGLPVPERRIGQTAHDFVSALGTKEVIMTRALKSDGSPTIPSRFIQRMSAAAGSEVFNAVVKRGRRFLSLASRLDEIKTGVMSKQPRPTPPRSFLPNKLSVTEIEILRRDPYSIYAKHVLKLEYIEKIGSDSGRSERGNIYHLILSKFSERWPDKLPDDPLHEFLTISHEVLSTSATMLIPEAVWWPGIIETGRWYIQWEQKRRNLLSAPVAVERLGALAISLPRGGDFTLTGRADRIELLEGGAFNIIDYKTGRVPSQQQVRAGFSSQLTLEAAMLKRGAFSGLSGKRSQELLYVKIGRKDGGEEKSIRNSNDPLQCDDIAEGHFSEFVKLVDDHWNGGRPFYSRPYLQFMTDFSKYDHLARFREWSLITEDLDGGDTE